MEKYREKDAVCKIAFFLAVTMRKTSAGANEQT
jgi:hypothetical protein